MHAREPRRGFTLLEVIVAITVGALALAGAQLLIATVADDADRLQHAEGEASAAANGSRLLVALLDQVEVGTDSTRTFSGTPREARFTSWCQAPGGWSERCEARLVLVRDNEGEVLAAVLPADTLVLRRGLAAAELRYLRDAAEGGRWLRIWGTSTSAPLAIGLVLERDTVILRIGERG